MDFYDKQNKNNDTEKGHDVKYELDGQLFIWNSIKYDTNIHKHKITFEEAATVFMNYSTEYYEDRQNSYNEERFIALGMSKQHHLLVVCHCMRESETIIRIISARKADKNEQKRRGREI